MFSNNKLHLKLTLQCKVYTLHCSVNFKCHLKAIEIDVNNIVGIAMN